MSDLIREALSSDGYIIDQDKTYKIFYGPFRSSYNGCGWIAAYNYLKATHRPHNAVALARELATTSPYNARMGTGPLRLRRFLEAKGCRFATAATRQAAAGLAPTSAAGILFYTNAANGPHFVCYVRQPSGRLRFFNALPGNAHHITTMVEFLRQEAPHNPIYLMAAAEGPTKETP
ncbi:hypothetical protein LJC04_05165 [Ruminococcaceae bacterium OttesenSCG-928-O06]|nr:hypothetical protein [Ruminococcaceae bacterium OttesenSCG-928-O06]